ncbi:transposase [Mesorhizobium sp. M0965]|uniref:transposase n=1 Tax=Mesorhizobium sp. M0965 TaxID=2957036 RepID=UPI003336D523
MPNDRSFLVLEAAPNRLEASPQRSWRRWSAEAKSRLIEATLKPGANVSAIARQAGMAPAQLFGWRSKAIKSGAVTPQRDADRLGFVEVAPKRRFRQWKSVWAMWSFGQGPMSARIIWPGLSGPARRRADEGDCGHPAASKPRHVRHLRKVDLTNLAAVALPRPGSAQ